MRDIRRCSNVFYTQNFAPHTSTMFIKDYVFAKNITEGIDEKKT